MILRGIGDIILSSQKGSTDERNEMPADNGKELKNESRGKPLEGRILEFSTMPRRLSGILLSSLWISFTWKKEMP